MIIIRIDGGCPRPAPTLPPLPPARQEPSLRSFRVHCILPSATRNQQQCPTKSYLLLGSNNNTNSIKASTSTNINKKINTNNNNTKNQNNNNRELLHCNGTTMQKFSFRHESYRRLWHTATTLKCQRLLHHRNRAELQEAAEDSWTRTSKSS